MNRLVEHVDEDRVLQDYTEKELRPTMLPKPGHWLKGGVQNVEIINARGELERVYFPVGHRPFVRNWWQARPSRLAGLTRCLLLSGAPDVPCTD